MKAMQALGKLEQKTKYLAHVLCMVASNELQEEGNTLEQQVIDGAAASAWELWRAWKNFASFS